LTFGEVEKQSDDNIICVKWKQIHWRVAAVLPPPPESTPTANHTLVINSSRLTFGESEKQSDGNIICVTRKQIHRRVAAVLPPPPESTPTTNHTLVINSTNSVTEESLPIIGLSPAPIAQNLNTSSSITEDHQSSTTFVAPSQDTLLTTSLIQSREKSDSLHEHYNVPLKKDSPVSPFVHQLLKHATFAMNAAEEDNVQQVLASKGVTVTDFDENFFFNREYWYKHVRMVPKEPDEASANFCWQSWIFLILGLVSNIMLLLSLKSTFYLGQSDVEKVGMLICLTSKCFITMVLILMG
jgi:hypothetical protein